MYAHQIIDDLKKDMPKNNSEYIKACSKIIETINDSQKFYIGEVDKQGIIEKYTGKQLFNDPDQSFIKFPYEKTWIDWQDCSKYPDMDYQKDKIYIKKLGALIVTLSNKYHNIFLFNYLKTLNRWILLPIFFNLYYDEEVCNFLTQSAHLNYLNSIGKKRIKVMTEEATRELTTINLFIDLLNCKNITTIDNPPPKKLNKKRIKNNKQPLFTFKTLIIKPTGKKQKSTPRGLWENRVHLCRGHFKEFTKENPLFGKHTGRYWWQPSARGNSSKGVIEKDYTFET